MIFISEKQKYDYITEKLSILRTFALIVCADRYCAGNVTVICHALLPALVELRF